MYNKLTEQEKASIVSAYTAGQAVIYLCAQHGVPRSTIYSWIKRYQPLKTSTLASVSYNDYYNLKRRADKLEELLKVIKV
jgi:transposase-like protein